VKTFQGGVCVSDRPDVDVVDSSAVSAAGGDAGTILNTNVDMFSVGFQMPSMEASAGETLTYTLFAESQAAVTLDLEDQSTGLTLNPSQASVTLGSVPFQLLNFSVQAPAAWKL
jgi:plastocyanin